MKASQEKSTRKASSCGVGELDQVERGGVDGGALVVHGAGAVDEDAERDGEVLVAEAGDGLRDVVLEDAEGVLVEGLNGAAGAVEDGGVEADLVGILAQGECAA